jgi:hypothetical protein
MKILIAGDDYFDNAKCSVILDHLVIEMTYDFLIKPQLLMTELADKTYDLIILSLDIDSSILNSFKQKYLDKSSSLKCLFFAKQNKNSYSEFYKDFRANISDYPFLTTPLSPIKFASAFQQVVACYNKVNDKENDKTELKIEFIPYVPIKLQFLRKFTDLPFNIFLQLRKDKYVKIRNVGETLEDDLISRYKSKGIKEFYLTLEDFHSSHDLIYNLPFISSTKNPKNPEQHIKEIHEVLIEVIRDVGLNDVVIGLANQYAHSVLEYTGSKASLALMMEASIKNQYSYIYDHSYLTSVICAKVSNRISWMTTDLEEKICKAAVFHDLALSDTKYPYVIDVEGVDLNEIPKKERKEYTTHPTEMATILRESESISEEVIKIVLQHHETVDGDGFPKKLSSLTMTPIVGLFIMVHDFVDELYRANFDCQQYSKLVIKISNKYDSGNFREVAKAFKQTLKAEL